MQVGDGGGLDQGGGHQGAEKWLDARYVLKVASRFAGRSDVSTGLRGGRQGQLQGEHGELPLTEMMVHAF